MVRVQLKLKKIARDLRDSPADREWRDVWPLIDPVEGWLYPNECRWLCDAARSLPGGANIVEIGSYKGRSTCCLGFGAKNGGKKIFAIDTFDGGPGLPPADSFKDFARNIQHAGLSGVVTPMVGLSGEIAKGWNRPIHMLFIDGSHEYEHVLADFAGFFPFVVKGGVVAFHDVNENWPGVLRAWNENIKEQLVAVGHCQGLGYGRKPA